MLNALQAYREIDVNGNGLIEESELGRRLAMSLATDEVPDQVGKGCI